MTGDLGCVSVAFTQAAQGKNEATVTSEGGAAGGLQRWR